MIRTPETDAAAVHGYVLGGLRSATVVPVEVSRGLELRLLAMYDCLAKERSLAEERRKIIEDMAKDREDAREAIEDAVEYGDLWTAEFADSPDERAQWAENRATLLNLIKETT